MAYNVILPNRVQKELAKLSGQYRVRVTHALVLLGHDPFLGKKLLGERKGEWSHRVWPYRILYEIHRDRLIVLVIRIAHRGGAYR